MTNVTNVVSFQQNGSSVFEDILTYLNKHEKNSENTKRNYERSIRDFYMFLRNKEIEALTTEDLKVRNADVLRYQGQLSQSYANNTVNNRLAAIASLYEFLEINEYPLKAKTVCVDALPEDSEGYGDLYIHEVETMMDLVKEQVKGFEKSMLIRLAYTTSFRKETLLTLEWNDIEYNDEQKVYLVRPKMKNMKNNKDTEKPISPEFYNELRKISELKYNKNNDDKVFHLSPTTIQHMMDTLKEKMEIREERNIVFHSFRSVLPNYIYDTEKDIRKVQEQLDHSNIQTSAKHYLKKNKNYTTMAGIQIEKKIDEDIFDQLSHEELLILVKGMTNGTSTLLKLEAQKLVEGR